jgi:hypothetical protein
MEMAATDISVAMSATKAAGMRLGMCAAVVV